MLDESAGGATGLGFDLRRASVHVDADNLETDPDLPDRVRLRGILAGVDQNAVRKPEHGAAGAGGGLLGRPLGRDHRQAARSGDLDSLPLGGQTFPTSVTYWRKLYESIQAKKSPSGDLILHEILDT